MTAPSSTSAALPAPATGSAREPLLSVRNLRTYFKVEGGVAKAVDGVSFDVYPGEVLGIVGESGSGKSVASLSILRLIPDPPGFIAGGEILFRGQDLVQTSYPAMQKIRGAEIAMIFQEPMTALNPVFTVGKQVIETIRSHHRISHTEAFNQAVEILEKVGIPDARKRMTDYPHQFSGGMRQRVMIAIALSCNPALLIADEPTTALDVTTQAQILELMLEMQARHKDASIMLITHDLGVVAETCHRVVVMYGGKVQEVGTVDQIFSAPKHPYTQGLMASLPSTLGSRLDANGKVQRLKSIQGNVPSILDLPAGCKFCTRCSEAWDRCSADEPALHHVGDGHMVRCHLLEDART